MAISELQALVTHGHPREVLCCKLHNQICQNLLKIGNVYNNVYEAMNEAIMSDDWKRCFVDKELLDEIDCKKFKNKTRLIYSKEYIDVWNEIIDEILNMFEALFSFDMLENDELMVQKL